MKMAASRPLRAATSRHHSNAARLLGRLKKLQIELQELKQ